MLLYAYLLIDYTVYIIIITGLACSASWNRTCLVTRNHFIIGTVPTSSRDNANSQNHELRNRHPSNGSATIQHP